MFKNLPIKQSSIWLIVFGLGLTGVIFLLDQPPAPLNQSFATETLIQPEFDYPFVSQVYGVPTYTAKQKQYRDGGFPFSGYQSTYTGNTIQGEQLTLNDPTYGEMIADYQSYLGEPADVFLLTAAESIRFTYDFASPALSYFAVDYYILDQGTEDTKVSIKVNDDWQFYESQAIILPSQWQFTTEEFALDRYQNELQPSSAKVNQWQHQPLRDMRTFHANPFAFFLSEGDEVSISFVNAQVLIGRIYVIDPPPLVDYQTYRQEQPNAPVVDTLKMISSRSMVTRTDASIRLRTEQDASAMFYNTQFLRLNTIFGDSWERGGQAITYAVNIEATGYYALSFKYRQYLQNDMITMRSIYINGEIPFKEFLAMAFPYTMQFRNRTLAKSNGEPYYIYLEAGTHTHLRGG